MTFALIAALIFLPMLIEAAVSSRHERALRALGAIEPPEDVYRAMAAAYPGAFVVMIAEGVLRSGGVDGWFRAGLALFVVAKTLKYWAITSLGPRWTFRVLVPPGSARTVHGPYRFIPHPNYLAVTGELAAVALAMHAIVTGPLAIAGFGWLMLKRIQIEENALMRG